MNVMEDTFVVNACVFCEPEGLCMLEAACNRGVRKAESRPEDN